MHTLEVGSLYNPARTRWPEGSQLRLSPQGCELLLLFNDPTNREITATRKGHAQFALYPIDDVLLWLYTYGQGIPWSDAPWEARLQTDPPAGIPGCHGDKNHLLLNTVLVNARTGIIAAMRQTSLPSHMADAMREAIDQQHRNATPGKANTVLNDLYNRYTSAQLAKYAPVTCDSDD